MTRQTEPMSPDAEIEPAPGALPVEPRGADQAFAVGRRRVLGLAVAAGAVGLVAACGGGNDSTSSAATTSGSSPSTPSSSPPAGGLAKTAEIPVGGGVVLEAKKVVVTQPAAGTFKAFTATCTHASCIVASVANGLITCPCHGSQYSATDGSVKRGPATGALTAIAVKVEGDSVVRA
jgi:Rieske Fe-S protein